MTTPAWARSAAITTTAVIAAIIATACATSAASGPSGSSGTSVTEVHLSDGTRCAVMDKRGTGGVALDCDWRTP